MAGAPYLPPAWTPRRRKLQSALGGGAGASSLGRDLEDLAVGAGTRRWGGRSRRLSQRQAVGRDRTGREALGVLHGVAHGVLRVQVVTTFEQSAGLITVGTDRLHPGQQRLR